MKLFSVDNYVHGYLDRRMEMVIDEWNLARKGDVEDFSKRIENVEKELPPMKEYEKAASARLTGLEERFRKLKEAKR
ncbi:MAG: hypothetical protein LUP93_06760 [Methanomicrobiales archaeon]|nr:hypothetical protein [Methanomicrobiales archaeon]MDD1645990.1 hypothetical protein [Methanomicrobiales archaeon]MDD1646811.1 hypothetical protein [Methanomicrobiales archaeon]